MLEVRWGEAPTSWIEQARPALKSLRAMAGQIEHEALTAALDGFDAALGELAAAGRGACHRTGRARRAARGLRAAHGGDAPRLRAGRRA